MLTINLWDSNFPGQSCSVAQQESSRVRYVRDQLEHDGITVFTDGQMFSPAVDQVQSPIKVGWLQEPRPLHPENYARSWDVRHKFDAILTYDQELLDADPERYRFTIRGGVWMPCARWGVYPKSRNVSMILSETLSIESHRLRHLIADTIPGIDLYGARGTPIGYDKAQAYRDYRYAIVVDTTRERNYFSEHLLDAISFGCVPVYWGCPNIGQFLNDRAIIPFVSVGELVALLPTLTKRDYTSRLPAVRANLACLDEYRVTEDWQAEHIYQPMLEAVCS
jgi:hypothetical protein